MKPVLCALAPVLVLCLAACGGSPPPEPANPAPMGGPAGHHGGGHHEHGMMEGGPHEQEHDHEMMEHEHMKPELHAFHEVLAPVWHSQPGDVRIAKACDSAGAFRDKAAATGDAALVDAAAQLATACASKGPPVEAALQKMHERFHALAEMH